MNARTVPVLACLLIILLCSGAYSRTDSERDMKSEAEKQSGLMLSELSAGRYDTASAMAKNLLSSYPDTPASREAYYVLGLASMQNERFKAAEDNFRTYVSKGGSTTYQVRAKRYLKLLHNNDYAYRPLALFFKGEYWLENDRPLKTLRYFREILKDYPKSKIAPDALNGLGYVYLVGLKNYAESIAVYKQMLQDNPDNSYTDNAIYGIARSCELSGKRAESIAYYEQLLKKHALLGASVAGNSIAAFNEYSRLWHRRASLGLKRLQSQRAAQSEIYAADYFLLGFGDRLVIESPAGSGRHYQLWQKIQEDGLKMHLMEFTLNAKAPVTWENRQELLSMAASGYAPVVIFQYFDINLSPEFVKANEQNYYTFIQERLIPLLKDIPESYILLEAEFNRGGVGAWSGWDEIAANAIRLIHQGLPQAKVGLTAGDWNFKGREDLKISMRESAKLCDFIGYQFMISGIEENFSQDPAGQLLDRVLDFADFLKINFNKPLLIGYLGVSTYGGWEQVQAECLETFFEHIPDLKHLGVFGMVYFSYVDDPQKGGWFGPAEQTFGIVTGQGSFKAGWHTFKNFLGRGKALDPPLQLLRPVQVARSDKSPAAFPLTISAELSRPALWKIIISANSSGATRTFTGFSRVIRIQWNGDADTGRFGHEECKIMLAAKSSTDATNLTNIETRSISINAPPVFDAKTVFAEGYSHEAIDHNGTFYSPEAYEGNTGISFKWAKNMAGTTYRLPLATPEIISADNSLTFNFKARPGTTGKIRMILKLSKKEIPFTLAPFIHRNAGRSWSFAQFKGEEILKGYNWNSTSRSGRVSLKSIGFQSLVGSNALHIDNIKITSHSKEQPQSIIPYFQDPFIKKKEPATNQDSGHIGFFPRR